MGRELGDQRNRRIDGLDATKRPPEIVQLSTASFLIQSQAIPKMIFLKSADSRRILAYYAAARLHNDLLSRASDRLVIPLILFTKCAFRLPPHSLDLGKLEYGSAPIISDSD
jgi:hypothetical protein